MPLLEAQRLHPLHAAQRIELRHQLGADLAVDRDQSHRLAACRAAAEVEGADVDAFLARERGLDVREVRHDREGDYHTLVRVSATTPDGERSVAGTLFGNAAPRLVDMFGIRVEAELEGSMIYIVNEDTPGFIGRLGSLLGEEGVNIGTFNLGRRAAGGEAGALVSVDSEIGPALVAKLGALGGVKRVEPLRF